jgi:dihydrofolate synthase / folylpolyglutamate synthase
MNYAEVVSRLFKMNAEGRVKSNLDISLRLSEFLKFPERSFKSIHIAGTNGKGSVALKIAKALECSGLKVGLYTSPHLFSFRERILSQGQWISEDVVVKKAQVLFEFIDKNKIPATFFELTTALAFDFFREQEIDVAVIETGLGGRFDATNVIMPCLSVITSISRDHSEILGDNLDAIAQEKAGIIKPLVPVVVGPKARVAPILAKASLQKSRVFFAPKVAGFYDEENKSIARTALQVLSRHFSVHSDAIEKGLQSRPQCRFEEVNGVLFDVAHNPDGFFRLREALDLYFPFRKIHALVGMSKDKEIEGCLKELTQCAQHIFLVKAPVPRAASTEDLAEVLTKLGYFSYTVGGSVHDSVIKAYQEAQKEDALLAVCGSFFIMKEARLATGDQVPTDCCDLNERLPSLASSARI